MVAAFQCLCGMLPSYLLPLSHVSFPAVPALPSLPPAVMVDAFQAIWELHTADKIPLRTAAFVKALQRVTRARVHRGFD